jgi:hypothetical protein
MNSAVRRPVAGGFTSTSLMPTSSDDMPDQLCKDVITANNAPDHEAKDAWPRCGPAATADVDRLLAMIVEMPPRHPLAAMKPILLPIYHLFLHIRTSITFAYSTYQRTRPPSPNHLTEGRPTYAVQPDAYSAGDGRFVSHKGHYGTPTQALVMLMCSPATLDLGTLPTLRVAKGGEREHPRLSLPQYSRCTFQNAALAFVSAFLSEAIPYSEIL